MFKGTLEIRPAAVDASLVSVPIQRNGREENRQIREGNPPQEWSEAKSRQKDTEARWTVKNGKSTFGYKNHIEADVSCKLIRRYAVTPASVHDSQVFKELLDLGNTSKDVWADSAYRSAGSSSSRMGCFPEPRKPQLHLSVDQ